jgi:hypothetical protein
MTDIPEVTRLISPAEAFALAGILKIVPTGLSNAPGVYFLLHRPSKRAYVGVVKSIAQHATYLRGQFARTAKGLPPTLRLANLPDIDNQFDNWVFRAIPHGDADLLRATLAGKGVIVANLRSRVRGKNVPRGEKAATAAGNDEGK